MCVLRACVDRGFLCLIVVQLVRRILVEKGNPSLKQLQGLMEKLERERIHEVNTNSRSSLKLTSIESVMPSSHLILCCPLFLLPPIPPSISVLWTSKQGSNFRALSFSPRKWLTLTYVTLPQYGDVV